MDRIPSDFVQNLFQQGLSDREVSLRLTNDYPGHRGFSVPSVRKWRLDHGLHRRAPLSKSAVEEEVRKAVGDIGAHNGRRFVKAYIQTTAGVEIAESRVGSALRSCFPDQHAGRQSHAQQHFNPVPYHADYFGHKLHMDQNEKLVNFGVTHVAAIDGFSGLVVAHSTMPVKNNITIYDRNYRKTLTEYGLWDQIVVDQGKEFYLTLYCHDRLKDLRHNASRKPYLQIQSTKNNRVERIWVEVNQRVNYPIKTALENLVQIGALDRDNPYHRFAVSWVACEVSAVGLERLFTARNSRHCRKRGVPQQLMLTNNRTVHLAATQILSSEDAADSYRQQGGTLSDPKVFGVDPAAEDPHIQQQRLQFIKSFQFSPAEIYSFVVNGQPGALEAYLKHVCDAVLRFRPAG